MRNLLSNLTAALLALHTVLGCCWHHEHRCTEACSLAGAAEFSHHCDGSHAPGDGTAVGCPVHGHQGPHECQGATCSFLGPIKQKPHDSFWQVQAAPAISGDAAVSLAAWGQLSNRDAVLPSLRLHLIHHVLLI